MKFYVFKKNPENTYKKEDAIIVIGEPDLAYTDNNKACRCPQPEFVIYNSEEYIIIEEDQFDTITIQPESDSDNNCYPIGRKYADLDHRVRTHSYMIRNNKS